MAPLPPVDGLELIEAHAALAFLEPGNGLVFLELRLPGGDVERRHYAGHRLPLHDRETRLRKPRRTADDERHDDQRGDRNEPGTDGAAAGGVIVGGFGHAARLLAE